MNHHFCTAHGVFGEVWLWVGLSVSLGLPSAVQAQIVPDGTLGADASMVLSGQSLPGVDGAVDLITGGAQQRINLFHSFEQFNVGEGQQVYFAQPNGVEAIFGRVTGDFETNILGTLGVDGAANLFLINPHGILFGPNAQLDIEGSFTAATASEFRFEDGQVFSAVNPGSAPLLQMQVFDPQLWYSSVEGTLRNQGVLEVGQDLHLGGHQLIVGGGAAVHAGRDLILQGTTQNLELGHYTVGGYLKTQDLQGETLDFVIPHDNIIIAANDVVLNSGYQGKSLYILAGGSVTGLNNSTLRITAGSTGTVDQTLHNGQTLRVSGNGKNYLDVRSNLDWETFMGTTPSNTNRSRLNVTFNNTDRNGIDFSRVTVFNEVREIGAVHLATELGDILVDTINTKSFTSSGTSNAVGGNGGNVALIAQQGNIAVNKIDTSVFTFSRTRSAVGGDGGRVLIQTGQGDIFLPFIKADSFSRTVERDVNGGDGGDVSILTDRGTVTLGSINLSSLTFSGSSDMTTDAQAGQGGNLSVQVNQGDILISDAVEALSFVNAQSSATIGAPAGNVFLQTHNGNIIVDEIDTSTISRSNNNNVYGAQGGQVILAAEQGRLEVLDLINTSTFTFGPLASYVQGGDGGSVQLLGQLGINSEMINASSISNSNSGKMTGGNGGSISFSAVNGDISASGANSVSFANSALEDVTGGNSGSISLATVNGNISASVLDAVSVATSNSGDVTGGNSGSISLATVNGNISASDLDSTSFANSALGDVTGGKGGSISFSTTNGNISNSASTSASFSTSDSGNVAGGNGSSISFFTQVGNLQLGRVASYAFASSLATQAVAGSSGDISIMTQKGSLLSEENSPAQIYTWAASGDGRSSGAGGQVDLRADQKIQNYEIATQSASDQAGDVTIEGLDNLEIENLSIITSQTVEIKIPLTDRKIQVQVGQSGQSGNVSIGSTGFLTLRNTTLQSSTQNNSPAGNVTLHSTGLLTLEDNTKLSSNTNNTGTAGNFTLSSDTGILITGMGTRLSATTKNLGPAGNMTLSAPNITFDRGATLQTSTDAPGNAGNITLQTGTFNLSNGAEIISASTGAGNSGQILINASEAVNLGQGVQDASPVISVETSNAGRAGDIILNTPNFTLSETARITATATATATNTEGGGSISINANTLNLAGIVGIFAETQGQAPAGSLTFQSYQANPDLRMTLFEGSTISASTRGSGNGGGFQITAPQSITIAGAGKLAVETTSSGNAGNIAITTQDLTLTDGVEISASTYSQAADAGRAGDISLTAENFTLSNGASIRTNTFGVGNSGNIKVNASKTIDINNGSIEATTGLDSTGNSGNIDIDPINTYIRNGGRVAVDSQGTGTGGSIRIVSGNLYLDNGSISALTRSSDGGNITLTLSDLFRLQNSSFISTEAGTAGSGGNGGDIDITAAFVIALPGSNSDIIANAFEGNGGNININALGIFGFEVRSNNSPRQDPANNLTASSRFGTSGTVATPNVDPSQGLGILPATLIDPSSLIDRSCSLSSSANRSKFTIAGRGGLATSPNAQLSQRTTTLDLRLQPTPSSSGNPFAQATQTSTNPPDFTSVPRFSATTALAPCTP